MKYIGVKFLGYDLFECEVIIKREKQGDYLVKDRELSRNDGTYCAIMTTEEIEDMLQKQEKLKQQKIRSEKREQEIAEKERLEKQNKENKENLYGFGNNKTDLQKGKILSTLMKSIVKDNKIMTKKDFIIACLKEGYKPEVKEYKKYSKGKEGVLKSHYVLSTNEDWYEVLKTEYDFAKYMIDNNILISL